MVDPSRYFSIQREDARARVAEYFAAQGDFKLLTESDEISANYKNVDTWAGSILIESESWPIIFIFGRFFPTDPPLVICPKAKKLYLTNPHVLEGGYLCILSDSSSVNTSNIEDLLSHFLYSARKILSGTSDADFREEFSSYWNRKVSDSKKECLIVSSPQLLEKTFYVLWGEKLILISHDEPHLNQWWRNYLEDSKELSLANDGVCVDIDSPLIPSEYPENSFDLLELVKTRDKRAYDLLSEKLSWTSKSILVLLRQKTDNGFSLGCAELKGPRLIKYKKHHHGFRPGHIPTSILIQRSGEILRDTAVNRHKVKRMDYDWIHSRGGDGRNYASKSIAIIGCGSVGGYIAHTLAKSGIGRLLLVDKEKLEWANIGRHVLGAHYVGLSKVEALRRHITKEMPHLNIDTKIGNWQELYEENNALFDGFDAIIVSIADWKYEKPLNYLSLKKLVPTVLFTWLEPYAVAGHCFVSSNKGCLNCHMNELGQFTHAVSELKDGTLKREPGGCTFYQPYGPTMLLHTVIMSCRVLLKHLINPIDSTLYTWISDEDHFNDIEGNITEEWSEPIREKGYSRVYENVLTNGYCEICSQG
ncbi:ThiF family adenylyltransferase [Marispirochaeta aestuarii]|uniref:ThiF family adenylyltransferase n=1 Tax=Marispirochaeta aestuarii TaxID=1963862 RepID=UPI0029C63486|nr:ThiF family adenylyltransferase [Marispirochaeta aestuarii]